jgi:hypothetical protein
MTDLVKNCERGLTYPFDIEVTLSKYIDPVVVQFDIWSDHYLLEVVNEYTCSRFGSVLIMSNESAVMVNLTYGHCISHIKRLESYEGTFIFQIKARRGYSVEQFVNKKSGIRGKWGYLSV